MWSAINSALNALVDALLWPVQELGVTWQVAVLALPATVIALLVFRLVSNQDSIRAHKDKIKAYLLEMLLYKDDLSVTFAAQGKILTHSLRYMGHTLVPMAVMLLPFILIIVQVESRFAFHGLVPGVSSIITVAVDQEQQSISNTNYHLELPQGLSVETPAVRIAATGEVVWRIRADQTGKYTAIISAGDRIIEKHIMAGENLMRLAPSLYPADDIRTLGFPAELALPADQPVTGVSVVYPRARGEFAGLSSASWLLFLFSIIFGFMLRGVLGVTF